MPMAEEGDIEAKESTIKRLKKLRSSANLYQMSSNELELKANLYYHISNPIKRWKTDRSPPFMLILQVAKTICIVVQVILFMNSSVNRQSFELADAKNLFECLLLNQCSATIGDVYQAYSIQDVKNIITSSTAQYSNLLNSTVYGFDCARTSDGALQPIEVTLTQYAMLNLTAIPYMLDTTYKTVTFQLDPTYDVIEQLTNYSEDPLYARFVQLDITYYFSTIQIMDSALVQCYTVKTTIQMQTQGGGIVSYSLRLEYFCTNCNPNSTRIIDNQNSINVVKVTLSGMIIVLCTASLLMVIMHVRASFILAKAMGAFYKNQLSIDLSWKERLPIFSRGHIFNVLGDLVTITGTIIKINLDYDPCLLTSVANDQISSTRILLGISILLEAAVILRFISYFKQFNAVHRALSIALPKLGKYIFCALILFLAFMMCGWLVLSPFHYKFANFGASFQALYTMMHGDDLFLTYQGIGYSDDPEAYIFSQFFFTIFLMLFIYAMLNLMISLIMESYEESQDEEIALKNEVRRFVYSGPLTPGGVALKDFTAVKKYVEPDVVRRSTIIEDEHEVELTI
ncbi:hypothetical protein EMCRGX_G031150 [Ephydatia muelleri]